MLDSPEFKGRCCPTCLFLTCEAGGWSVGVFVKLETLESSCAKRTRQRAATTLEGLILMKHNSKRSRQNFEPFTRIKWHAIWYWLIYQVCRLILGDVLLPALDDVPLLEGE